MLNSASTAKKGFVGLFGAVAFALLFVLFEAGRAFYAGGIEIRVEGNLSPQEREQLNALIDPYLRSSVLVLNSESFVRDIGSLPWVGAVEVRPIGINQVSVRVSHSLGERLSKPERTLVNTLSNLARAINTPLSIRGDQIDVQDASGKAPDREFAFLAFEVMLEDLGLHLEEVRVSASGHVELSLEDGKALVLGKTEPLARMQRFAQIYQSALKPEWSRVDRVDARYRDGVAVSWTNAHLVAGNFATLPEAGVR